MKRKLLLWFAFLQMLIPQVWAGGGSTTASATTGPVRIKLFGVDRAADCGAQLSALQEELESLQYPAGWTIAVTCRPGYWSDAVKAFRNVRTTTAFTLLSARLTILNGEIFQELRPQYRRVIAHELGHILCQCRDEARANEIAWSLVQREGHSGTKLQTSILAQ